jgi:hypothetical protein
MDKYDRLQKTLAECFVAIALHSAALKDGELEDLIESLEITLDKLNYVNARKQLLAAVRSHKDNGGKFCKYHFGIERDGETDTFVLKGDECCGLAAFLLDRKVKIASGPFSENAAAYLNVSKSFILGFVDGFDGIGSVYKELNEGKEYQAGYKVGLEAAEIAFGETEGSEDQEKEE